jgi:hypothetical protein
MWEVWIMIRAAAWLRDPGRVAETADVFERLELIGPLAAALRSMLEGVGRALAGDREAAAAAFMKAADLLRRYGDAEKLFTTLATFAALVGQDHPEAAAAAREAQEWALETRANCLRQVYADGMPPPATDAAGTAG